MVILFDQFHLPEDIFEIVFATEQQISVARMLTNKIKSNGGTLSKTEMSKFATELHSGIKQTREEKVGSVIKKNEITISYNKRQFYDRILTPMKSMGLIDYDLYKKQYLLSDKFNKNLTRIGIMWVQELKQRAPTENEDN
jgi:hypothetical protein